jgi:imidazolonepropionase-like amidohydrolase
MSNSYGGAGTDRSEKIALTNVRVFDGRELRGPTTVVIEGGFVGRDSAGARVIDAGGTTLLSGFIDAHVHLLNEEHLQQLADFGVTTALDMGAWPPSMVDSLRRRTGMADRSAGIPAAIAGSTHSHLPGYPTGELVDGPTGATRFVTDRIAEGADYIKLIADIPGPDQEILDALVAASHDHGKLTVAHAVSTAALDMALQAGVDMITHVPLDRRLTESTAARVLAQKCVSIPTLTMMKGIVVRFAAATAAQPEGVPAAGPSYGSARGSVAELHRAGVPILAGTDANAGPGIPFSPRHGESLHDELELLIDAGLSTVDALRAATVLPAQYFGLHDRGVIEPGRRADLVLIDGDPIADIRATRQIRRVWCAGVEHRVAFAA